MKKVAIVIPIYLPELSMHEVISLNHLKKFCSEFPLYIVHPIGLSFNFDTEMFNTIALSPTHFKSWRSYSNLCLKPRFYKQFTEYEYILIYQLDAYVFSNQLSYWCSQNFSYIGAPWIKLNTVSRWLYSINKRLNKLNPRWEIKHTPKYKFKRTGNGGLSLRNVNHTISVLTSNSLNIFKLISLHNPLWGSKYQVQISFWKVIFLYMKCKYNNCSIGSMLRKIFEGAEDEFFFLYGEVLCEKYKVAPPRIANFFALDRGQIDIKLSFNNGILPFGGHDCFRTPAIGDEWRQHVDFIGFKSEI